MDAISKCKSNEARKALSSSSLPCEGETAAAAASSCPLPPPPPEVNLDHILSCVPYRDLLRDVFGCGGGNASLAPVPVVTKSYEVTHFSVQFSVAFDCSDVLTF